MVVNAAGLVISQSFKGLLLCTVISVSLVQCSEITCFLKSAAIAKLISANPVPRNVWTALIYALTPRDAEGQVTRGSADPTGNRVCWRVTVPGIHMGTKVCR